MEYQQEKGNNMCGYCEDQLAQENTSLRLVLDSVVDDLKALKDVPVSLLVDSINTMVDALTDIKDQNSDE